MSGILHHLRADVRVGPNPLLFTGRHSSMATARTGAPSRPTNFSGIATNSGCSVPIDSRLQSAAIYGTPASRRRRSTIGDPSAAPVQTQCGDAISPAVSMPIIRGLCSSSHRAASTVR